MKLQDFKRKKARNEKISIITCYDYPSARIVSESNLDCVLVGDSVAMVVHGYEHTLMATIDMMVMHTSAVARGLTHQFLISDMPFLCHRQSQADTIDNVRRLLAAGAQAVKIEGGDDDTCRTIEYLVNSGVPVMGHIGLTPQSVLQLGGYNVQGKEQAQALQLEIQAKKLASAGCFALVLECIPQALAATITNSIDIPTIGIGAGSDTDGQVLVWHDLLGLHTDVNPRFVKRFAHGKEVLFAGIQAYAADVQQVAFPALEHTF